MADNSARIAEIQGILRAGARNVSNDGTSVGYDFAALRKELRELMADDDTDKGRRPTAMSIRLEGI